MTATAIVLAGGFGTRLQAVVQDVPKPMAPIAGKPFLEYLLDYLQRQGIGKCILSVGYKWDVIRNYFGDAYGGLQLAYVVEDEPLGTGGAILKSVAQSEDDLFYILNGDTFFSVDLQHLFQLHQDHPAMLSIALKAMNRFERYGVVRTDQDHRIISFEEKKYYEQGNINGGIYLLHRKLFDHAAWPQKFSFEKDVMEALYASTRFNGFSFSDYFIDIGIPQDYQRAQVELPVLLEEHSFLRQIDDSWTLFLDRDGVLNKKIDSDYVRHPAQFEWLPGVMEALLTLSQKFRRIIVVTNQQGVGKGLMTHEAVLDIHRQLTEQVNKAGGRIDRIYYAPQLKQEESPMRKPGTGMALAAKNDFPDIEFCKSVMVGDSLSDMVFGKNAGMKTVFLSHGKGQGTEVHADFVCKDLAAFTSALK